MKPILAACLISLLTAGPGVTAPSGNLVRTPSSGSVDAIFAGIGADSPGCAVAASRDGVVLIRRAYGLADLELKVPITPDSIFEAGSSSKQFVAGTVLLLARQGRLSLADDIRKYLPEMPDYGRVITVGDLVHHMSGIRDWDLLVGLEGWPRNSRDVGNADVLAILAKQKTPNFLAEDHVLYSNSNFNLLPIIIERATGQSFEAVSRKEIFEPLGMSHTSWRTDYRKIVAGRASAYESTPSGYRNTRVVEDAYGNGGLLTTVDDLALWQNALDRDLLGKGFTAAMQEPGRLRNGTRTSYGAGLFIADYHGTLEVNHEGLTAGYHAWVARYPAYKVAVSMLCNATGIRVDRLGRRVADLLLPLDHTILAPPTASIPSGTYADTLTGISLRVEYGGSDGLRVNGQSADYLGGDVWRIWTDLYSLKGGALKRVSPEGETYQYRLVDTVHAPLGRQYDGRYCASEVSSCVTIRTDQNGVSWQGPRGEAEPLSPAYADVFTGSMFPSTEKLTIFFTHSPTGSISELRISTERALGVAFARVE
jgi:CubicO group peptidase (beta-lactamase class C family)